MIGNMNNLGGKNSSVIYNSMTELIILLLFIYILIVTFLITKTKTEINECNANLESCETEKDSFKEKVTIILGDLERLKVTILKKQETIDKLENISKDCKTIIVDLTSEIENQNIIIHDQNKIIDDQNEKINDQKSKISDIENQVIVLIGNIDNYKDEIKNLKKKLIICQNQLDDSCPIEKCREFEEQIINLNNNSNKLKEQIDEFNKKLGPPSCMYDQGDDEIIEPLYIITIYDKYMKVELLQEYTNILDSIPEYRQLPKLGSINFYQNSSIEDFKRISKQIYEYSKNKKCRYFVKIKAETCKHKSFNKAYGLIEGFFGIANSSYVRGFRTNGCNK